MLRWIESDDKRGGSSSPPAFPPWSTAPLVVEVHHVRGSRFSSAAEAAEPPVSLLGAIAFLAVTYLFLVQAVKSWFYRRHALL